MQSMMDVECCTLIEDECQSTDLSRFKLKTNNISNLLKIQGILNMEEGRIYNLDEVLERILSFYRKFVPF